MDTALCACTGCKNPITVARVDIGVEVRPLLRTRDVRTLAAEGSIGAEVLSRLDKAIEKLPMLPHLAGRVSDMANDPSKSINDLSQIVREDPVIALRVMKMANSVVYGGLQEIKDLDAACSRLGTKLICNAVQTATSSNLFACSCGELESYMRLLWRHSVATGYAAQAVATAMSFPKPERLFLAGLIHDIGKLVILDMLATAKNGPLALLRDTPELCYELIEGFHLLAGLHIVQHWELAPEFLLTTFAHHDPGLCQDPQLLPMVHALCLADAIARIEGYTTSSDSPPTFLSALPSSQFLNMTDIRLAGLRIDLTDKVEALLGEE